MRLAQRLGVALLLLLAREAAPLVARPPAVRPARRAGQFNMMGARARMGLCVCVVVVCVWRQGFQNRKCTDQPAAHSAARARDGRKTGPQRRPTPGRAAIPVRRRYLAQ